MRTIELSDAAAATIAGLVAETDELQEFMEEWGEIDGEPTQEIFASTEVWKEIRDNFPLDLFKKHGEFWCKEQALEDMDDEERDAAEGHP